MGKSKSYKRSFYANEFDKMVERGKQITLRGVLAGDMSWEELFAAVAEVTAQNHALREKVASLTDRVNELGDKDYF